MNTVSAPEQGTGSKTMADLAGLAAAKYGDKPALRHKAGDPHEGTGEWAEISYVLEHSESKAVFVDERHAGEIDDLYSG